MALDTTPAMGAGDCGIIAGGGFCSSWMHNPARVADPPGEGALAKELASRIDPNTADWPAWVALPLIGEKRAKEIVAFRDAWVAEHPGKLAFEKLEDLTLVKGIGKETIKTLAPFLEFPAGEKDEK